MTDSFIPAPGTERAMRDALGLFATGVTVVTTMTPDGPLGMTANSFTSVSMDPPLILWCPAKRSGRHDPFLASDHFALHVMGEDQDDITRAFAASGQAFDACDWISSETGMPLIEGAPARFECHVRDRIDAGDHTVVIGHVDRVTTTAAVPRVLLAGAWGQFLHPDQD